MDTCFVKLFLIITFLVASVDSGRPLTTLYTIKKFDFDFNKDYFRDVTAFYLPVKNKWGRIGINLTVIREITSCWMTFNTFRQDEDDKKLFNPMALRFHIDICDIAKDGADGMMFKFLAGLYEYFAEFFHSCSVAAGTQMVFADRTIASIPRKGQGPFIPSGYYKFTFDFRSDQNISLALVGVDFQYRGF